jgi:DNA-binding PadR family transcriptional regulator
MSLKHVLLGFLNYGPMTGYELKKFFDPSVGHLWRAELSQIYPTLKQLESQGLVDMDVEVQTDRPNRKIYSITDDGARELHDWLANAAPHSQIRDPLMIKVFFGASLHKRQLIAVLRQRADELRQTLGANEHGRALVQKFAEMVGVPREGLFWSLTLDADIRHRQASLDWVEDAIRQIERLDDSFFTVRRSETGAFDARRAVEMLAKLKGAMPDDLIAHHTNPPNSRAASRQPEQEAQ